MHVQYLEGFLGINISAEEERISVDRSQDIDPTLELLGELSAKLRKRYII
jgi:hypothetical protein